MKSNYFILPSDWEKILKQSLYEVFRWAYSGNSEVTVKGLAINASATANDWDAVLLARSAPNYGKTSRIRELLNVIECHHREGKKKPSRGCPISVDSLS